jgi:hypothetical protein
MSSFRRRLCRSHGLVSRRKDARESTNASLTPHTPITLVELLEHIHPGAVLEKLRLNDILQVGLVSLNSLVDDYFVSVTLPLTRVIFRYKTPGDIEYPNRADSSYEHLVPVIKRISKGHRIFLQDRIVYEPEKRKFQPDEIEVVIPEERGERKITVPLNPHGDETGRRGPFLPDDFPV